MAHLAGFGRPNTAVGCLVVTLAPVCQRPALDEKSRSFAVVGFLAGGGFGRPSWATTAHGPALSPRRVGLASLATPHAPFWGRPARVPPHAPLERRTNLIILGSLWAALSISVPLEVL